ncbi:hypothetical protein [Bacterioplanoides pacificum]|uniref:Uncharacterized protein n=1 Tax=Bacterioplanoides pacificum TaxID=1171596 RepID=A0ABV7VU99_9GAMM
MSLFLTSPPQAGDNVTLDGRPGIFLSPQPVVSCSDDLFLSAEQILRQNDVTMDIGFGDLDGDFASHTRSVIFMLYVFSAIFISSGMQDGVFDHFDLILTLVPCAALLVISALLFGWQIFRRRRRSTVRFNRQRRELCYRPPGSKTVRYVPWEKLVAYIYSGVFQGATASGTRIKMNDYGLRLAEYNPQDNSLQCFYRGESMLIGSFSLGHWEVIRRFMDEPQGAWLTPSQPLPDMHSFRQQRRELWQAFKHNANKRWLTVNLRDFSESWITMSGYYLFHLLFWWQIPYLVSGCFLRFAALRPWPQEVLHWSRPLPQAQWAQASEQYLSARQQFMQQQSHRADPADDIRC